jgi:hypothetical protein
MAKLGPCTLSLGFFWPRLFFCLAARTKAQTKVGSRLSR